MWSWKSDISRHTVESELDADADAMCTAYRSSSSYHEQRRQRQSRAGVAWRKVLQMQLRRHQCDLDILLDPSFLHFSKSRVTKYWFPRSSGDVTSLADALEIVDREEP
ncbi:unnamed protein product [Phytophthora fragariaefolia]|uniref:Unnamed protein product n=1 Tax=Phytophthora fragariaefolia TaxID=1490495 RepID=A0A9W6TY36_9STRA|nr:unnamed protein product [Phytophthora fragariaefolia]